MRLLADENFPLPAIEALRHERVRRRFGQGHATLARMIPRFLNLAEVDAGILLTLDKDFWQITVQRRELLEQSGVIQFRVHPAISDTITQLVLRTLAMDQQCVGHSFKSRTLALRCKSATHIYLETFDLSVSRR